MKNQILLFILQMLLVTVISAQTDTVKSTIPNPVPENYEVKQALEVESLFPMFFTDGYHACIGYRFEKFRVRISIINGGTYNAERAGINNSSSDFERYYKTSPGLFLGYNLWKNLDVYTFIELHTYEIKQTSTGMKKDIHSTDFGGGISYQFFLGRNFYIQPGFHIYLRGDNSQDFNGTIYNIPNVDLAPVIRIGYRVWSMF
jgi:hypothetical protein